MNANIVISNELGVGFHDWSDFLPFYRKKFLSIGREDVETTPYIDASHRLFQVTFPEFAVTNKTTLIKILQDKRVADLRQLVQSSVEGQIDFDEQFARSVFREVIGIEQRAARYRNIVSYLTIPLDFLPWIGTVTQKAVEEGIGFLIDKRLKEKHRWFYLLSDLAYSHDDAT